MTAMALQVALRFFALIALVSFTFAQTSIVSGRPELSGTPISYSGQGGFGHLLGSNHIELNYDTDKGRRDARKRGVCPGSWKNRHPCPETNQPNTVPANNSYGSGSYPAARYIQNGLVQGNAGFHGGILWHDMDVRRVATGNVRKNSRLS